MQPVNPEFEFLLNQSIDLMTKIVTNKNTKTNTIIRCKQIRNKVLDIQREYRKNSENDKTYQKLIEVYNDILKLGANNI